MILNNLRCEYLVLPLSIDRISPRLSWELLSPSQGDRQTAYQIQAGSTVGASDLWDTGKVVSANQNQIAYAGAALTSRKAVFWRVRVYDASGVVSQWFGSTFEVGLLLTTDWAGSVTPYNGQFASRCSVNNSFSTTNFQMQAGSAHYARSTVTGPKFGFTNWCIQGLTSPSGGGTFTEAGLTGNTTIRASLEYPLGTFTQLTFNGSSTATLAGASGGTTVTAMSDAAAGITILSGALFRIHTFFQNAGGIVYDAGQSPEYAPVQNTTLGEYLVANSSGLTDNTATGAHGTNITTARYSPYLAVAVIAQPSVLAIGDSRTHGTYDTISDANSEIGNIARTIGPVLGYTKHSSGGNGVAAFLASHAQCVAAQQYFSHVIIELGVNDLYGGNGTTASTVLANLATMRALFSGKIVAETTLEPETSGSWGTVASQSLSTAQAAGNTQRVILNDTLRAGGLPNLAATFDIASVVESSLDSGYWAGGPISQDGVHENQTGYTLVATSGVIPIAWFTSSLVGAKWIGYQTGPLTQSSPAPCVRKTFTLPAKTITRGRLYASALGVYRPFLNGSRVGQIELAPGWTDYSKRRHYQAYDVTAQLIANGVNALGLQLGDGWALGNLSVHVNSGASPANARNYYFSDVPRGLAVLYVDYSDGTSSQIATDATWTATSTENVANDLYNGSSANGPAANPFTSPTISDALWPAVSTIALGSIQPSAQLSPPIKRAQQLYAVARTNPTAGTYIFDMGQNHSGIPLLKVVGATAGTVITLKHAEDLASNGSGLLYTGNLRAATATDTYACIGEPVEFYEPVHTWHGFRYVQVTGYPGVPPMDAVVSSVLHADAPEAGSFTCSNPVLTQIWKAATWTLRSNMITMPTDCNQRDERLGWTNDAQLSSKAAVFSRDYAAFYSKFCDDMDDGAAGGSYPDIAPFLNVAGHGAAGWAEAGVIIPWLVYQTYGDTSILSRHYTTMKACVNAELFSNTYGDYLNLSDPTNATVFQNAWAYRIAQIMQQVATLLGQGGDASAFGAKAATFAANFAAQVAGDGTVTGNSQTGYVLGLAFGLIPPALVPLSFAKLVALLAANGMTVGFCGLAYLSQVLADGGRLDLAYRYLEQTIYPSWGYDFSLGMTTMGENWAARNRQGSGDQANSYNHPVRAAVATWLMNDIAGIDIDPASPGFANAIMRPRPAGSVTWANGAYKSIRGLFESKWTLTVLGFQWRVVVPPNATCTITIPPAYSTAPVSGGQALTSQSGVIALSPDSITAGQRFSLPSGTYNIFAHA